MSDKDEEQRESTGFLSSEFKAELIKLLSDPFIPENFKDQLIDIILESNK